MTTPITTENPLVSVIVPVYNVEAYLHRCVQSILEQSYTHLEIILVNDGSADNSGEICDQLAQTDNRIKVIHQENNGVSAARNNALDIANGEYISFVDSDDWIHTRYIELLAKVLTEMDADIAECDKIYTHTYIEQQEVDEFSPVLLDKTSAIARSLKYGIWGVPYRMFRKTAVGDVRFNKVTIAEDAFFTFEILAKVKSMGVLYDKLYYYYHNSESATKNSLSDKKIKEYVSGSERIKSIVTRENNPFLDKLAARNLALVCIRKIKEISNTRGIDQDYKQRIWLKNILLDNMWGDPKRIQFLMVKYLPLPWFSQLTNLIRRLK
ncbi:glycosyltransferase family 2 protein [Maribacter sp. CXY002]|uniref:glycosyltransferase family 2 protein n=1 Tax=Maribacter luteocoastalis TaxID=3407671 RepID=UPI003B67A05F